MHIKTVSILTGLRYDITYSELAKGGYWSMPDGDLSHTQMQGFRKSRPHIPERHFFKAVSPPDTVFYRHAICPHRKKH
jgi:hypothetical protein